MKILITGINGFLGSALFQALKNDHEIIGLGRESGILEGRKIYSAYQLEEINLRPDFVLLCHAAVASGNVTLSTKNLFDVNVHLTKQVLNAFIGVNIIYISSASVFKIDQGCIDEFSTIYPQSEYAISKFWGEELVMKNKNSTVIRFSSLYGPGMKEQTLIPIYVNQAINHKKVTVWGTGDRRQNYLNINDAVEYILRMMSNFDQIKGKKLLGVNSKEYSNLELAKIIVRNTHAILENKNSDNSPSFSYRNEQTVNWLKWLPKDNLEVNLKSYIKWKIKL